MPGGKPEAPRCALAGHGPALPAPPAIRSPVAPGHARRKATSAALRACGHGPALPAPTAIRRPVAPGHARRKARSAALRARGAWPRATCAPRHPQPGSAGPCPAESPKRRAARSRGMAPRYRNPPASAGSAGPCPAESRSAALRARGAWPRATCAPRHPQPGTPGHARRKARSAALRARGAWPRATCAPRHPQPGSAGPCPADGLAHAGHSPRIAAMPCPPWRRASAIWPLPRPPSA